MAFVFSKKLLDYARQQLVMNQFGDDVTFKKNQGTKTIRWLRPAAGDRAQVQTLSEGVPLATYTGDIVTPLLKQRWFNTASFHCSVTFSR